VVKLRVTLTDNFLWNDFRGSPLGICPPADIGGQERVPVPVDPYQQRASECLWLAQRSPNAEERVTWRELALCWLRLSEHAERFRHQADAGMQRSPDSRVIHQEKAA
jgi:hypothetical protein